MKRKKTEQIVNLKGANLKTVKLIQKDQPLIELIYFKNKRLKRKIIKSIELVAPILQQLVI